MHGGATYDAGPLYESKDPLEELVAIVPSQRNVKGIIISILVICVVVALVALSVVIVTPPKGPPRVTGRRITLEQINNGTFSPNSFNATWVTGSELAFINMDGGLSVYNTRDEAAKQIASNSTFRTFRSTKYIVSASLAHLILVHEYQPVYRHSSIAKYTHLHLHDPKLKKLTPLFNGSELQVVFWIGDTDGLMIVKDNDIFHQPNVSRNVIHRLTHSGSPGVIYNGITDWLYEEEVLYTDRALWVSPDNSRLAFLTFDDTDVEEIVLNNYGNQYKEAAHKIKYPKAGGVNPVVSISVMELLQTGKGRKWIVKPPTEFQNRSWYVTSVVWVTATRLSVTWLSRKQDLLIYTTCHHPAYQCTPIAREMSSQWDSPGWVQTHGDPVFSLDGSSMLVIKSMQQGEPGPYPHLVTYMVNVEGAPSLPLELTQGNFEVTKINGWDENNGIIYITATSPDRPQDRRLLSVSDSGSGEVRCLTCHHNNSQTSCAYTRSHMSPSLTSYVQECLGPSAPFSRLISLPSHSLVSPLDLNSRLDSLLALHALPQRRFAKVSVSSGEGDFTARLQVLLPPGYRDEDSVAFPTLFEVYGGPNSQMVSSMWRLDWDSYMVSNRGYVVIYMDVRGSGFQGDRNRKAVYRNLGTKEIKDILYVIRKVSTDLPYIDRNRMAIWGWSFGGYLAAKSLATDARLKENRLLLCGIAVAPVSRWQHYDSAYSERYMGDASASDNWEGYEASDLTKDMVHLLSDQLLLIHGSSDDNVHLSHSMALTQQLVLNHILFSQMIYPGERHSLSGVVSHFHSTMEVFLEQCMGNYTLLSPDDIYYTTTDGSRK